MKRFTEYHNGVPVILDKGPGQRVEAAKRFAELEERATEKEMIMQENTTYPFKAVGICPGCGNKVRGHQKFCDYCGQRLKMRREGKQ